MRKGHYQPYASDRTGKRCTACDQPLDGRYNVAFWLDHNQNLIAPSDTSHDRHTRERPICQRCIDVIATQSTHWTAD